MGMAIEPHTTPKAPVDRGWNRHGTSEASKSDDLIRIGHEEVDGRVRVVWAGVGSAMQVLAVARGGVDLPESDRQQVYQHLVRHHEEFDEEAPPYAEIAS